MRYLISLLGLLVYTFVPAQEHIPVFPNLTGDSLLWAVQDQFTPSTILNYSMARDTLFKNIDAKNDSLQGIYTGHTIYLPPDEDPTVAAFMNGGPNGINTEHAWPRSKGAGNEPAESDMHHLFPSRIIVNSDRANLPFSNVDDQQTLQWYINNESRTTIPSEEIDAYSELGIEHFEPRESVKGDIARAMFYFYTIYRSEAESADERFFETQRQDLCDWHLEDVVDQTEWERTHMIAEYQGHKTNPFILDCTLATRLYCSQSGECMPVSSRTNERSNLNWRYYPNPASNYIVIEVPSYSPGLNMYQLTINDVNGETIIRQKVESAISKIYLDVLPGGVYSLILFDEQHKIQYPGKILMVTR